MSKETAFLFTINLLINFGLIIYIMTMETRLYTRMNIQSANINKINERIIGKNGIVDNMNATTSKINFLWQRVDTLKK